MNIHLQFLKKETMRPMRVSLLLFGCLSATVISPTEASSDFSFDPTLFRPLSSSVELGNRGTTFFFEELDVTVTGVVRDQNQEPIPGVTVSVHGIGVGTATDMDGRYSITVPEGATLVFSFIGFNSNTVQVGNQTVIDVVLMEDVSSLEEVVVVGYAE